MVGFANQLFYTLARRVTIKVSPQHPSRVFATDLFGQTYTIICATPCPPRVLLPTKVCFFNAAMV